MSPWQRGLDSLIRLEPGRLVSLHFRLAPPTLEDWLRVRGSRCPSSHGLPVTPTGAPIVAVDDSVSGAGVICFFTFEGGFYAVLGTDGRVYDPINLPPAMRRDSLAVVFRARIRRDLQSFHMAGPLVELADIRPRSTSR